MQIWLLDRDLYLFFLVKRAELKENLSRNPADLYGVTLDFWTNKYTSDSYLTITLHHQVDTEMITFVLRTTRFNYSKTAGKFKPISESNVDLTKHSCDCRQTNYSLFQKTFRKWSVRR